MKRLLLILILTFSFQSLAKADDIRDFEVEGMSVGDSLLDYFNIEEIEKFLTEYENLAYEVYKKEINENVIEDILGIFIENNIKEACQTFILETNTKANNVLVYDEYLEEDEVSEILNFKDTILERIK